MGKGSPTFVFPPVFQKKGYALYGVGVVRVNINVWQNFGAIPLFFSGKYDSWGKYFGGNANLWKNDPSKLK